MIIRYISFTIGKVITIVAAPKTSSASYVAIQRVVGLDLSGHSHIARHKKAKLFG